MAQSELDLANAASYKLGASPISVLATDTTPQAKAINARIYGCRRHVLRIHPWNFATYRTQKTLTSITAVATADDASGEYQVTAASHGLSTGDKATITGVIGNSTINTTWTVSEVGGKVNDVQLDDSTFAGTYSSGGKIGPAPAYGYNWQYALPTGTLRLLTVNEDQDGDLFPEYKLEAGSIVTDIYQPYLKYIKDVTDYTLFDPMAYEMLATYLAWDVCIRVTQSEGQKDRLWNEFMALMTKARFVDATEDSFTRIESNEWIESRFGYNQGYVRDPQTG